MAALNKGNFSGNSNLFGSGPKALVTVLNKKVDKSSALMAITAIANPGTATAADCANKINAILAALKSA